MNIEDLIRNLNEEIKRLGLKKPELTFTCKSHIRFLFTLEEVSERQIKIVRKLLFQTSELKQHNQLTS
jgi:hypothetical protein